MRFILITMPLCAVSALVSGCAPLDPDYKTIVMTTPDPDREPVSPLDTTQLEEADRKKRTDEVILKASTPVKKEVEHKGPSIFAAEHNARIRSLLRGVKSDSERERIIRENGGYEY